LIRVFQNWHVSRLRSHGPVQALPEDDVALPLPEKTDGRWHDQFVAAAQDWLATLSEQETLLLGLRWRYRLSQRDISHLFGVHEGTISRQTDKLRDRCLESIGKRLTGEGWTGDDLEAFVLTELGSLLMDDPKLSADQLTAMMARRGKSLDAVPRSA
jgi:DNA-directed RNA polymerase specialized sigma24 family protein